MALSANELRIGNWIFNGGIKSQVAYLLPDNINCTRPDFDGLLNGEITPILLTEEWLLKFGFEIDKDLVFYKMVARKGHISLPFDKDKKWKYWSNLLKIEIQYVHQLQNLYFALTGSELEIK